MTMRILIVDDDASFCTTIANRLQREEDGVLFSVEQATAADEALQLAADATNPFDAFLIDHRLGPGLDGIEVIQQLKLVSPQSDAILFTGYDEPDVGLSAYAAGAYRYLQKPFKPPELIWILRSLHQKRATQYERDWLHVLTDVAEKAQSAVSMHQMADVLVQGGRQIGFERARLYRVRMGESGNRTLTRLSYSCAHPAMELATAHVPLEETVYHTHIATQRNLVFWEARGPHTGPEPWDLAVNGDAPSVGEGVGIPLIADESVQGILLLDNILQSKELRSEQRRLLRLFGRQASAAFERAIRLDEQSVRNQASAIVRRVMSKISDATQPDGLNHLLMTICEEFDLGARAANFMVVLRGDSPKWFYTRLHIEQGEIRNPYWRHALENGIVMHMVSEAEPLFLPNGTAAYRRQHQLHQVGARAARSWMGVPLCISDDVIGAMILEDDEQHEAYTWEDFNLLQEVAHQLAGIIQTAWLHEQQRKLVKQLTVVQQTSERLMILAEQREDWLWHATLTVATANYGFSFDRAVLFLVGEENHTLYGCMGIGHFEWEDAERDWLADVAQNLTFDDYLGRLVAGEYERNPTPVQQFVKGWEVPMGPQGGAFARVLSGEERTVTVLEEEARAQLPAVYVDKFGETDYALVPVRAGEKLLGLVVLDNKWKKDPQQLRALEHLDRLTDQAALIYENLKIGRAQTELLDKSYSILAQLNARALADPLHDICRQIKSIMAADLVSVYPFSETNPAEFDLENGVVIGAHVEHPLYETYLPHSLTAHILEMDTLVVNNISEHRQQYNGHLLAQHRYIATENIQAFIGVPIFGIEHVDAPRAILWINYRKPMDFAVREIRLAKTFARLIALVMRHVRRFDSIRMAKEARDQELHLLSEILTQALDHRTDKPTLIENVLMKASELLAALRDVNVSLVLKAWERPAEDGDPVEIRLHYYLDRQNKLSGPHQEREIGKGIIGMALLSDKTQNARDISAAPWKDLYRPYHANTRAELAVPVKLDDQVMGVLNVESPHAGAFNREHEEMLERLASVAALVLASLQRREHMQALLDAARAITEPADLQETLDAIVQAIRKVVPNLPTLTLWHEDPETGALALGSQFGMRDLESNMGEPPRRDGAVRYVMRQLEPLWVPDLQKEPTLRSSDVIRREGLASTAAFPLRAQRATIGALFFSYRQPHAFTEAEYTFFPLLAQFVAIGIHDALLLEQERREHAAAEAERKRHEDAIEIVNAIGGNLELEETLERILGSLKELYPHAWPCILLYDADERTLNFSPLIHKYYSIDNPDYMDLDRIPMDTSSIAGGLSMLSIQQHRKLMSNVGYVKDGNFTYQTMPDGPPNRFPPEAIPTYLPLNDATRSQFTITFYSRNRDQLLGVLALESCEMDAFGPEDERALWGIAKQIRFVLERHRLTAEVRFHDAIAGMTAWAADIAHTLNSEIGRIRRRAEWLRERFDLPDSAIAYANQIEKSAAKLTELSAYGAPGFQAREEDVNIVVYVAECVRDFVEEIDAPVQIQCCGTDHALIVRVHKPTIRRIMQDMVRNSLEAMKGLPTQTIILRFSATNMGFAQIDIEDTGAGITDLAIRQKVLQEPIPSKGPDRGRGLMLARYAIDHMGGRIRLLPHKPERGAVFSIQLPISSA